MKKCRQSGAYRFGHGEHRSSIERLSSNWSQKEKKETVIGQR